MQQQVMESLNITENQISKLGLITPIVERTERKTIVRT